MAINIKRTSSYTNQTIKFLKRGSGGFLSYYMPAVGEVCTPSGGDGAGSYDPLSVTFTALTVLTSSVLYSPVIYEGIVAGSTTLGAGYLWNSNTDEWDYEFGPDPSQSGTGRAYHEIAGYNGKIFTIGGIGPSFASRKYAVYNYSGDCWGAAGLSIPGFSGSRIRYRTSSRMVATNYATNQVYVFGGTNFSSSPFSLTWINQLLLWDGSSLSTVESSTAVSTAPFNSGGQYAATYLAARDTNPVNPSDPRTKLMLHVTNTQTDNKEIYLWTQNQTSPVSGTWSLKTGSLGLSSNAGDNLNMPSVPSAVSWDRNYSRWTSVSMDPLDDPNIWTSSDDGLTWTSGWYNSSELFYRGTDDELQVVEDPERSKFYLYSPVREGIGPELWELNVASTISDSVFTLVSGTSPSSIDLQFSISASRYDAAFGITSGSQPRILVYGGQNYPGYTGLGDPSTYRHFRGFEFDQGTSTWTQLSSYPSSDLGKGRLYTEVVPLSASNNTVLMIGGRTAPFKYKSQRPFVDQLSSITYDFSGNSWGTPGSLTGYSNFLEIRQPTDDDTRGVINLAATDYANGRVFLYGGVDSSGWKNQLSFYDPSMNNWTIIESSSPLPSPVDNDSYVGTWSDHYSLAARNDGGNTKLMLFTGSYSSFTVDRKQALWLWTQTSATPSGSWTFLTGSIGSGETMPRATVSLMYQDSQSRWVALSNIIDSSPNIWTSTDDGATWTAATFSSLGGWSKGSFDPFPTKVCASPASNEFYLFVEDADGLGEPFQVWKVSVDATPSNSSATKIWP